MCQNGVTLKCVSPIEIVIIEGAQFKHMLNIGTVPLPVHRYEEGFIWNTIIRTRMFREVIQIIYLINMFIIYN